MISSLRRHIRRISHVQIADSPGRHEPGTGEIDYRDVLGVLDELGYDGHVGLKYRPRGSTAESFAWLPRDQRSGPVDVERMCAGAAR